MSKPRQSNLDEANIDAARKDAGRRSVPLQDSSRSPGLESNSSEVDLDTGMKSFDKIVRRDAEAFRALAK